MFMIYLLYKQSDERLSDGEKLEVQTTWLVYVCERESY